jgi:LysR family transcriptional regulator, low CO2-responsive transcriptional regulator
MPRPCTRRYFRHGLLPQLIAFDACLRHGSVTRAAEELSLAQPTVSGLLRKLAETVGEPLLRARGGRVELTEAGHEVSMLCEEILESLGRFEARRQEPTGNKRGWSTI